MDLLGRTVNLDGAGTGASMVTFRPRGPLSPPDPPVWLAVGAPKAKVDGREEAGVVLFFHEEGPFGGGQNTYVYRAALSDPDGPSIGGRFGASLETLADLDMGPQGPDGLVGRLVVGSPEDGFASEGRGHAVVVRLVPATEGIGLESWVTISNPLPLVSKAFGGRIAAVSVDSDGLVDDLAFGMPSYDDSLATPQSGAVFLLRGDGAGGFASTPMTYVPHSPQAGGRFGFSVVKIDYNGAPPLDIAIGEPGRDGKEGVVYIYDGIGTPAQIRLDSFPGPLSQSLLVPGSDDAFGWALSAFDLIPGDGHDELLVGVPGRLGPGGEIDAGMACMLNFGPRPFQDCFRQSADQPEVGDRFGESVVLSNIGRSAPYLLGGAIVGAPGEDSATHIDVGAVEVVFANKWGPQPGAAAAFTDPNSSAVEGAAFGTSLLAHSIHGGTFTDVIAGVPGMLVGSKVIGAVVNSRADYNSPPGAWSGVYELVGGVPAQMVTLGILELNGDVRVSSISGGLVDMVWQSPCGLPIDPALLVQGFAIGDVVAQVDVSQIGDTMVLSGSSSAVSTTTDLTSILLASVPAQAQGLVPDIFAYVELSGSSPYDTSKLTVELRDAAGAPFCVQPVPPQFSGPRTGQAAPCE